LVASGPSGLRWRRELGGNLIAGLAFLALMAIGGIGGGLTDGDPATAFVGVACGIAAVVLLRARRPATVAVALRPGVAGCEIELRTTVDDQDVEALLYAIANASPESAADRWAQEAKSAYLAGRIDADELESAVADALDRDS
jgi:hypothetical protein